MQWAANFVAEHEPFRERPAVVRTIGSNGEEFVPASCHNHVFTAEFSQKHRAVRERPNVYPAPKIWSFAVVHSLHP
jgi:hypothetical protein